MDTLSEFVQGMIALFFIYPVVGAAAATSAGFCGRRLRRKGYTPSPRSLVALLAIVNVACYTVAVFALTTAIPSSAFGSVGMIIGALLAVAGPIVVGCGITACLCVAVPRRRGRTGPRARLNQTGSIALNATGCLVFLLGIVLAVFMFVLTIRDGGGFLDLATTGFLAVLAVFLAALGAGAVVTGADRLRPTEDDVFTVARKVLYLRPFSGELRMFGVRRHPDRDALLPFEEYVGRAVEERLGSLVALGNPLDRVRPSGARRIYCSDADWRPTVQTLAEESLHILATSVDSANTLWELQHLKTSRNCAKLFVVTPPSRGDVVRSRPNEETWAFRVYFARITYMAVHLYRGRYGEALRALVSSTPPRPLPPPPWSDVRAALMQAGYLAVENDPGPGAVVTFTEDGEMLVVATGADSPEAYVDAIRAHASGGDRSS